MLTQDVTRTAAAQHADRRFHCAASPLPVHVDADAITQLLWILIDNAVRHTSDGGNIWISAFGRGAYTQIQVSDDGVGIPAGAEVRIFDRFFQADAARRNGGVGLGLAIAQWIVTAHRGVISVSNNDRGGATFTVSISSIS